MNYVMEMRDPRTIEASPWNANVVSHENETKLRSSIERNGMFKPIIIRVIDDGQSPRRHQCIGGWHRNEQAIELGMPEVPVMNLGIISEERAKEISIADNARYGIDDTMRLSELLSELDASAVEQTMPWTNRDIAAITASLSVNVEDLDLDEPVLPTEDDEPEEVAPKVGKTHNILRFRCTLEDSAKISLRINEIMKAQGFTKEDELTNAGDTLAFLLLRNDDDAE